MTKISLFASILAAFMLAGCSASVARFTTASTRNMPLQIAEKAGEIIEGEVCLTYILGFTIGQQNDRVSTAVQKALENAKEKGLPYDALINAQIASSSWTAILFGQNCMIARGEPISVENSENATPKAQNRRSVNATPKNNKKDSK